ncbi:MAG: NAD(P)H-dependent oxidoreductase [Spirochaetia bacterium]|jgi:multimeric flavodoxin WrbA
MKIVVLNGSPKGDVSVTRQYVLYLEKAFPQHQFVVLHVAQQSKKLERDATAFDQVIEEMRSADGVIWAFPLYILLVCSQYKRFIELITERGAPSAFRGKHAVTLSTSINYFDSNAHVYMRSVCEDLGMRFVGIHSARMDDITKKEERQRLHLFAEDFFTSIERGLEFPRLSAALPAARPIPYQPVTPTRLTETRGRKIVILTDAQSENLLAMTARLEAAFGGAARTVNLHDIDIKGGCQGCLRCGAEYKCAYTGKDGFIDFYNSLLVPADIIVFAGSVVARQLSWKWREFFDRSFFNTHTPSLVGKQFAFLVSGPLSLLPELRETYEGWAELQRSNLVTFLSDETTEPAVLDAALDQLAERLVRFAEAAYIRPRTFLGVAGMKIFRDDIWSELKIVFRADHKAYRKMGLYDFPQLRIGKRIIMRIAFFITGLPGIRSQFPSMIRTQMIVPMRKAALKDAA